ncbi:MAG: hypothetical protein ACXVJD_12270 [Mucilaginibacter sp.]
MKTPMHVFLCLAIIACNANPKGNQRDSTKNDAMKPAYSGPFDLAKLKLNENLPDLMAAQGIKSEPKAEQDKTLLGYEIFKTSNSKALRFENADLSGTYGKNKNDVLLHYNEDKKTLAFYEVELYSQAQTDTLISLLGKVGTIIFKETKLAKGAIELDENGDELKPEKSEHKTMRIWENKNTGITYFLAGAGKGQTFRARLIVLKQAEQSGKDWMSYLSLDLYKRIQSEPL